MRSHRRLEKIFDKSHENGENWREVIEECRKLVTDHRRMEKICDSLKKNGEIEGKS